MYPGAARVGCFAWPLLAALAFAGCMPNVNDVVPNSTGGAGSGGSGGTAGGGAGGNQGGAGASSVGGSGGSSFGGTTATGGGGAPASGGATSLGGVGGAQPDGGAGSGGADAVEAGPADVGPANPLLPNQTMSCETPPLAVPTQHLEAECALAPDGASCGGVTGGQQGTQLQDNGTTVGYIEGGDALWFSGLRMDGATTLMLRYAKGVDGGSLEIRLDGTTGTLLGTFTPTATGSWTTWSTAQVALASSTGTHALYVVATGSTGGICNLDWLELSGGSGSGSAPAVHLNHLGFDSLGPKHAVVEGAAGLTRYAIVGPDGAAYWCGDLTSLAFVEWGSSKSFYSVDFTGLTRAGSYRLQIGTAVSAAFEISDDHLFRSTFPTVLDYFKASRADDDDVWAADASISLNGSDKRVDARGGWYDASGDISKYLTHLSYANFMNPQQIPLVAWALAWVFDRNPAALLASGRAQATQQEALWGADYLLRVLDPAGYFYTTVFDHWSGEVGAREICAIVGESGAATADYPSALREGGGMSIAALARIARWKVDGTFSSAQYLAGAEQAFAYLNVNGATYADDGKENVIDDYTALLAASELYATTQSSTYLMAARARATSLVARLSADGYFIADGATRPFWHASDAGLPIVALARYVGVETDGKSASAARQAMQKHLDYLRRITLAPANPFGLARQHTAPGTVTFFMPHQNETQYWWQGENARLGSLAAAAVLGAEALGTRGDAYLDLLRFAGWQVDWILGANPYDVSFLRGFGKNNPLPYCASKAQAGTLVGGISNGITGSDDDGTGIAWPATSSGSCGDDWRTVEQWLPHAAWYLVAVTALAKAS
jgi:hypothetical protein